MLSFALHKVKIDRSFLGGIAENQRALALLRNVARLIAELGMSVTMEGVETHEQLDLILGEGAFDEAQGYLFSPPVSALNIAALLDPATMRGLIPATSSRKVA